MFKRTALLAVAMVALVAGGVAQAKPGHHVKRVHNVPYIFSGVVVSTTAADPTAGTPASVTIMVKHSNRHAHAFRGQSVTLMITDATRLWKRGVGKAQLSDLVAGDKVRAKSRAPRGSGSDYAFEARWVRDFTRAATPAP